MMTDTATPDTRAVFCLVRQDYWTDTNTTNNHNNEVA